MSKWRDGVDIHQDEETGGAGLGWKTRSLAFDLLVLRSLLYIQVEPLSSALLDLLFSGREVSVLELYV